LIERLLAGKEIRPMADESFVLRGISWREVFPFTHLFRAFRIAIHPSKLVLALVCLLLIYGGGRFLDGIWPDKYDAVHSNVTIRDQETISLRLFHDGLRPSVARMDSGIYTEHVGPFVGFMDTEAAHVNRIAASVLDWNWSNGILPSILALFIWVPLATFIANPVFFILFWIWTLLVWSVFGGAIARIAAVHVARAEKLSVRHALRFSISKVLSFIFAPIIPLLIIVAIGVAVAIGGLLLYIPYVGPILVSILFFLGIAAGFVMALVLIGTIGGCTLMYPTVAVEGSDSFDAISRSFSYVYARPWRLLWYSLVALVYGALTYLFVRLFVFILLGLTHYFVTWFQTNYGWGRWNLMWPAPHFEPFPLGRLSYDINFDVLNWGEKTAAGILAFWVYLIIGMLGAYLISFYFSANTIIYYLMRREVDATEMDDVYLEETDEDFGDTLAAPQGPAGSSEGTAGEGTSSEGAASQGVVSGDVTVVENTTVIVTPEAPASGPPAPEGENNVPGTPAPEAPRENPEKPGESQPPAP
jgi:hypothetical protein